MKLNALKLAVVMGAAFVAASANAIVVFSNVQVTGSLAAGVTWVTSGNIIDFTTPNAAVGDALPARFGTLNITFEAQSATPLTADRIYIALLGALSGSGQIQFNEVVEDLVVPGFIGTDNVVLTSANQLPYTNTIFFSRPSTHVKVKKSFVFSAPDTNAFDLAAISLVEQTLVPEPGTIAAMFTGVAGLAAMRLRRRA